jgi:SagB-type dehydrogenase family enzyme
MHGVNTITLPQDILDRVARVLDFHESTKLSPESVRREPHRLDQANKPYDFRVFEMLPPVPLPSGLADLPSSTLSLMESGLAALPASRVAPPQDLKTLATWLHFAEGIANRRRTVTETVFTRTCASDGNAFPCELYVAAFGIDDLEPGLYHYSPREFALRKLRDGAETLARLTRGRPDLAFLKTVPLAMLVSTIFCRSTWRFGKRGYRHAIHDAGYLLQNLVTVATGLGVQTITRMILNDTATRELIGVSADAEFAQAEAVHGMVVWADRAAKPLPPPPAYSGPMPPLPPIERNVLAEEVTSYVSIVSTHQDCVAPGVAMREVRPPITEASPLPPNVHPVETLTPAETPVGDPLRKILLTRQATPHFATRAIGRDEFLLINRLAFRGGTFFPLHPDGAHVALVRPFWLVHHVTGIDSGVWYYHPPTDAWSLLRHGDFHRDAAHLAGEHAQFGHAGATCFLVANLHYVMNVVGPDVYRLAHLESGLVTNRLALSTEALDLGWCESGWFYDDEVRQFLGLRTTGWEVLNVVALGTRLREGESRPPESAKPDV